MLSPADAIVIYSIVSTTLLGDAPGLNPPAMSPLVELDAPAVYCFPLTFHQNLHHFQEDMLIYSIEDKSRAGLSVCPPITMTTSGYYLLSPTITIKKLNSLEVIVIV